MALLSRILVPVEFSARCQAAAHYAAALACRFHCEMILLHVVIPPLNSWASPEGLAYSSIADVMGDRVGEKIAQLDSFLPGELHGIQVQRVVVEGDPAKEIVSYAHTRNVDLIVMPTHGYGPFRRLLLGSVTAKVLHDAGCPVWTGPHLEDAPAAESIAPRRILCALDLGPDSRPVLHWAAAFAREFAADLAIVHALPLSLTRINGVYFDPEWRQQVAGHARAGISELQQQMLTTAEVWIENGDPPDAIRDAAGRWDAGLLVIGRGRRAGVLGRLRANAYAILRESPCPVVTV